MMRRCLHALAAGVALGHAVVGTVTAHPLPGTTVTVSADADSVDLMVSMPLHELELAMPGGTGLGPSPPEGPLPPDVQAALSAYLADHLDLAPAEGASLSPEVTEASIASATDDHVGRYDLVMLHLVAPIIPDQAVFPLTLSFDAVLHEVRSHRATVLLQPSGQDPAAIAVIRLDSATGEAAPVVIPAAP